MISIKDLLIHQYSLVQDSRAALLNFCATVSDSDFKKEVEGFGRGGSIRNLLVHINNTYQYWTGTHSLNDNFVFNEYTDFNSLAACFPLFKKSDELVIRMLNELQDKLHDDIVKDNVRASPFKVFTHVLSHEFHHKGQVLSISRHLGYIPVDTDIVR